MATDDTEYGPKVGVVVPSPSTERGVAAVIDMSKDGAYLIYANGPNVIVRSTDNPAKAVVYTQHTANVNVAKFSPSGKYVASGDSKGIVRVWAWTHPDHLLKNECIALGGAVEDLSWGPESKRICAVGGGSTKAKVFMFDTGSNLGEVVPLSKKATCCAMKPCRPYRAVWGGEDFELQFYSGPPFKYTKGLKDHTNFVNCVRYAPDGSKFVSVSSDKQAIVYDGATAEVEGKLDEAAMHKSSVYHCAWSPDGARLVTSSADKSLKIWDMASRTLVRTIPVGTAIGDMQNSVAWSPAGIVSLALDGTLRFFDPDGGDAPTRAVYGHQQAITAMAFDSATGRLFTTCAAGRMCVWHPTTEAGDSFEAAISGGEQHSKKAIAVAVAGSEAVSASWDRKLRVVDTMSGECTAVIAADCEPRALVASATNPEMRIAASNSAIKVFLGATQASETAAPWSPTCLSLSANGTLLAVGGEDKRVHFFAVAADGSLTAAGESPECAGAVSTVAVSPDNVTVAAGDALREVALFNSSTKERVTPSRWQSHTTRVTAIAWRPSGSHLVSVSTDRRLCIWDPSSPAPAKKTDLANPVPFTCVAWQNEDTFWTGGSDGVLRRWPVEL